MFVLAGGFSSGAGAAVVVEVARSGANWIMGFVVEDVGSSVM